MRKASTIKRPTASGYFETKKKARGGIERLRENIASSSGCSAPGAKPACN